MLIQFNEKPSIPISEKTRSKILLKDYPIPFRPNNGFSPADAGLFIWQLTPTGFNAFGEALALFIDRRKDFG